MKDLQPLIWLGGVLLAGVILIWTDDGAPPPKFCVSPYQGYYRSGCPADKQPQRRVCEGPATGGCWGDPWSRASWW